MEAKTSSEQGIQNPYSNWVTLLLAFAVTANVCIRIAVRWPGYDWLSKSLALVLLASLMVIPVCTVWSQKAGKKVGFPQFVQAAYMWLLLATLLFAR